jgi:hypothetical protein
MKRKKKVIVILIVLMGLTRLCIQGQTLQQDLHQLQSWQAGCVVSTEAVRHYGLARCFRADAIPDAVFARMRGNSFPPGCTIARSSLRYVRTLYVGFDGHTHIGELVCNKLIAADLVAIFRELYQQRYPIGMMRLIDDYHASDEESMRANNTSCFCYRVVKGSAKLSKHAEGLAVDINPLYNPCVRRSHGKTTIQPATASRYTDRSATFAHKITRGDLLYKVFTAHGFRWGGAWRSVKDYQHFEK